LNNKSTEPEQICGANMQATSHMDKVGFKVNKSEVEVPKSSHSDPKMQIAVGGLHFLI